MSFNLHWFILLSTSILVMSFCAVVVPALFVHRRHTGVRLFSEFLARQQLGYIPFYIGILAAPIGSDHALLKDLAGGMIVVSFIVLLVLARRVTPERQDKALARDHSCTQGECTHTIAHKTRWELWGTNFILAAVTFLIATAFCRFIPEATAPFDDAETVASEARAVADAIDLSGVESPGNYLVHLARVSGFSERHKQRYQQEDQFYGRQLIEWEDHLKKARDQARTVYSSEVVPLEGLVVAGRDHLLRIATTKPLMHDSAPPNASVWVWVAICAFCAGTALVVCLQKRTLARKAARASEELATARQELTTAKEEAAQYQGKSHELRIQLDNFYSIKNAVWTLLNQRQAFSVQMMHNILSSAAIPADKPTIFAVLNELLAEGKIEAAPNWSDRYQRSDQA